MSRAQMAISSEFPKEIKTPSRIEHEKTRFGCYRSGISCASLRAELAQKLTEEPQPHDPFAFGFENLKPLANSLSST